MSEFDYGATRSGLLLIAWGLFKKLVLANRLAVYVDSVYNYVHDYTGLALILATYACALQIYFDFSGYTDMARGVARIFGIELTENFTSLLHCWNENSALTWKFQISDFRFQISDFKFQISNFRFQISDPKFQISNFKFQISNPFVWNFPGATGATGT
ncbi:MAG: hypothetical protein NTX50_13510 [Candidatus Sumerlaeota bacterium]|nr:hypothetical protein [Candidatus Sumerlaeota bacterium]